MSRWRPNIAQGLSYRMPFVQNRPVRYLIHAFGLPHGCADLARRSCWSRGVHILMDGKGRWPGNVYVERLWRSLKQEEVYWHAYKTVGGARKGIADYLRYFNEE